MRLSLHLVYPTASHGLGDPGKGIRPNVAGTRSDPPAAADLGITAKDRALPSWSHGSARTEGLGLHSGRRPRPQPRDQGSPSLASSQPRARRVPHLCVCWYSGLMLPALPGPAQASHETRPHSPFRLPASGHRTLLPCPLGLSLQRAPPWWRLREGRKGTSKEA